MTHWWTGIAAAATTVECRGHSHTLRWDRGELTAVDHDDPEREATLAALAGETIPCLDRLRAWNQNRDDVRVLTLASRGPTDQLAATSERHQWAPTGPYDEDGLLELLTLGGGLPDRLQAHAAATWTRRLQARDAGVDAVTPQLTAALYGRLLLATRAWLAEPGLSIDLTMVDGNGERRLAGSADALAVTLPFAWLSDVWARGFTTAFGRLCLNADSDDGVHWTLDTVEPDLTTTAQLSVTVG